MNETTTFWENSSQQEIPTSSIKWLTDRTRMSESCDWKRWARYHSGPSKRGVESTYVDEELILGSAVHRGLELLLCERPEDEATQAAYDTVASAQIAFKESELLTYMGPEVLARMRVEQALLAQMLVKAFSRRYLTDLLSEYEVLAVEEEIAWPLWSDLDQFALVMSRPDMVLKHRTTDAIVGVSYKTTSIYRPDQLLKFQSDLQKLTEGWAIHHRYGRCDGILYAYFIKGGKSKDKNLGNVERYTSSLIRPWLRKGVVGTPQPSDFRMVSTWIDDSGSTRKLGTTFELVDVWEVMDMEEWFEWLDQGLIDTERQRDWLSEAVALPPIQPWNRAHAERWLASAVLRETDYLIKVKCVERGLGNENEMYRDPSCCFNYNRACTFYDVCWGTDSLEARLANGKLRVRTPNHPLEGELNETSNRNSSPESGDRLNASKSPEIKS